MDRLQRVKDLREEADRLEREANRPMPEKWKHGMRVRFLHNKDFAWQAGSEATIIRLSKECHQRKASEYQVFWTEPDGGGASWWTTPDDVEWVKVCGGKDVDELIRAERERCVERLLELVPMCDPDLTREYLRKRLME